MAVFLSIVLTRAPLRRMAWWTAFWMVVLAFYTIYFGRESGYYRQSFIFVCLLLPVAIATTIVLSEVLTPRYLMRRRYGLFALYAGYTAVGSVYLELVVLIFFYIFVAEYQIETIDPAALDVIDLIVGLYIVVFLALSIQLGRRSYHAQALHARAQQGRLEAELKFKEAELALLRAQIHPHFLFNTLNNLYGLALERSDVAPDVVLKLSDLLDYVLYRAAADYVPLSEETDFLRNYLELEQLRHDERLALSFEADDLQDEATIAPLLLIPFVENCFTHGIRPSLDGGWIKVRLTAAGNWLYVNIENSKPSRADVEPGDAATMIRQHSASPMSPAAHCGLEGTESSSTGLGLENVRRRLDLLYPRKHQLDIENAAESFSVRLWLQLDQSHD